MSNKMSVAELNCFIDSYVLNDFKLMKLKDNITEKWYNENIYYLLNKWSDYIIENNSLDLMNRLSVTTILFIANKCEYFIDQDEDLRECLLHYDCISLKTLLDKYIWLYIKDKIFDEDVYNYNYFNNTL
jgi:hypothetical protein